MRTGFFTRKTTETNNRIQQLYALLAAAFLLFVSTNLLAQDVLTGLTSDGGIEGKGTVYSIKTDTKAFSVIKGFANWGEFPKSDLVRGSDGNYYGMTPQGGTYNQGTIFRITPTGDLTVIKHFDLKPDGGAPLGSLIVGKDGNFYGLTSNGGAYWGGVIFRLTPAGEYKVLKSFNTTTDGYSPQGRLVQDADGTFYGLTNTGGAYSRGTIFKFTTGNVYTVLKSFNGTTEGGKPRGSLVQGTDGAFYGMTHDGGTYNSGVVFRITTTNAFKVIRHLNEKTDGSKPHGDLIKATDGWLYGMTSYGGANYGGTIFKIKNDGTSFSVLKPMSASLQGGQPYGSLVQGSDGSFYGMAYSIYGGYSGCIFKLSSNGSTLSIIKKFTKETDGGAPFGSLIQGADGWLYGMTYVGGKYGTGTIFKTTTTGATFTVLSHLNGAAHGNAPQSDLTIGKDSAYFGVTQFGGAYNYGTVYKLCGGVTTVLKSFNWTADGAKPTGGLLRGKDGNLYGSTQAGGANGGGTIFKITPGGTFSVLRHLKGPTDGALPQGTLTQGPDGFLYGTTYNGGSGYGGTIFRIGTSGGTTFKVLRHLVPATDGSSPSGGLVFKDGAFYGMTGTSTRFFKVTPDGQFTVLKTLNSGTEGRTPFGKMIIGSDGFFYGTFSEGGTYNSGTIFRISTTGAISILRHLNSAADGGTPKSTLVQGSDGAFYGTTSIGGTKNAGTIFKITSAKAFSVLRHFNLATDGGTPLGGLIIAPKIALVANSQSGLTTTEDVAKAITLTGSGAANLTFAIVTKPRNGSVSTGTSAARTYTPRANFYGVDSFAFVSSLGCLSSTPAWVKITVSPVNDAPVLATIGNKSVVKGTALTFTAKVMDPDPGQIKSFSLITPPGGATISATTGSFSWTPTTTGTFTFKVRVTDNGSPVLYDEATITVTVTAPTLTTMTVNSNATAAEQTTAKAITAKTRLYPNPVADHLTVTLGMPVQQVLVTIADIKGSVIYAKIQAVADGQIQLDVTTLKAGAYFIQLQSMQGTEVLKFLKR